MTLRNAILGAAASFALALPSTAVAAPDKPHGKAAAHNAAGKHRVVRTKATAANRWNGMACAPGLAKKNAACVPPGQWRRGDRLPYSWTRYYTRYDALPDFYRSRYAYDRDYRYIYRNDRVYVIDAVTRAILNVIGI